jgi:hypothetical protein
MGDFHAERLSMSMLTREQLRRRFSQIDDPEILARRQVILDFLLEDNPEIHRRLIEQGRLEGRNYTPWLEGVYKGELIEARAGLRAVLGLRQCTLSVDDDAHIEACDHLETLRCWRDRAVTAASVSEVLEPAGTSTDVDANCSPAEFARSG